MTAKASLPNSFVQRRTSRRRGIPWPIGIGVVTIYDMLILLEPGKIIALPSLALIGVVDAPSNFVVQLPLLHRLETWRLRKEIQ